MKFSKGMSRFVVCIGPWTLKFARIKILHWMARIPMKIWTADRSFYTEKLGDVDRNVARLQHLFTGIVSNLEEYRFYKEHPEIELAETIFTFFGLFNLQRYGQPIDPKELDFCPFREIAHTDIDMRKVEHFGRIDGRIVLLDYGSSSVNADIARICNKSPEGLAVAV